MKGMLSLDIPSDASSGAGYDGGPLPFGAGGMMGGGYAGPAYGGKGLSNTMSIELWVWVIPKRHECDQID